MLGQRFQIPVQALEMVVREQSRSTCGLGLRYGLELWSAVEMARSRAIAEEYAAEAS